MMLLICISFLTNVVLGSVYVNNGANVAYTWGYSYPQSCQCTETGVALTECTMFKCGCVCDVTAGKCDYNCCCDPDCSSDQVSFNFII